MSQIKVNIPDLESLARVTLSAKHRVKASIHNLNSLTRHQGVNGSIYSLHQNLLDQVQDYERKTGNLEQVVSLTIGRMEVDERKLARRAEQITVNISQQGASCPAPEPKPKPKKKKEDKNWFEESFDSFQEIGQDIWAGLENRADKRNDSWYDLGNYWTLGAFDAVKAMDEGLETRYEKSTDSTYDFFNYWTLGTVDLVNGAVNTEDPLSKEHWMNSFELFAKVVTGGLASTTTSVASKSLTQNPAKIQQFQNVLDTNKLRIGTQSIYARTTNSSLVKTSMFIKQTGRYLDMFRLPPLLQPLQPAYGGIGPGPRVSMMDTGDKVNLNRFDVRDGGSGKRNDVNKIDNNSDNVIKNRSHISKNGELKPNVNYQTGEYDYIYKTDELGRLTDFNAEELKLTERDDRLPHKSNTPGKEPGDHAGHLAADRFGGSPDLDNLVSQSSSVNLSGYKKLENIWAKAIEEGKDVSVNVKVNYEGTNSRPASFEIKYSINGVLKKRILDN
ncbi:DNA/RNA non-specific endonuclease [Radiobacillus kanasensis]|uniref:DNA/RNA non-specific endonuclease n=1 Tax=Radiobacillus kanasensis TaxID=2844358 RepID=UPI001E2F211E|nr:DNA/RNA non-specific endonuclease [Radiobacillus kanasensis]UFT98912.1 DNA/RNA non-specific endonuclease [Radiobacillus kanasensis]